MSLRYQRGTPPWGAPHATVRRQRYRDLRPGVEVLAAFAKDLDPNKIDLKKTCTGELVHTVMAMHK